MANTTIIIGDVGGGVQEALKQWVEVMMICGPSQVGITSRRRGVGIHFKSLGVVDLMLIMKRSFVWDYGAWNLQEVKQVSELDTEPDAFGKKRIKGKECKVKEMVCFV
ncbi:hypothetical protein Ancab_034758 [Ancistrocladus abbreviatus]